jgi:hypothetical protein
MTMTDETAQETKPADATAAPASAVEIAIPQVGDVLPQGTVFGVRRFAEGGIAISLNGVDWTSVS